MNSRLPPRRRDAFTILTFHAEMEDSPQESHTTPSKSNAHNSGELLPLAMATARPRAGCLVARCRTGWIAPNGRSTAGLPDLIIKFNHKWSRVYALNGFNPKQFRYSSLPRLVTAACWQASLAPLALKKQKLI